KQCRRRNSSTALGTRREAYLLTQFKHSFMKGRPGSALFLWWGGSKVTIAYRQFCARIMLRQILLPLRPFLLRILLPSQLFVSLCQRQVRRTESGQSPRRNFEMHSRGPGVASLEQAGADPEVSPSRVRLEFDCFVQKLDRVRVL